MTYNMRQTQNANNQTQGSIDNNRPAEIDELNFDQEENAVRTGDELLLEDDGAVNDMDASSNSSPDGNYTEDDLTPETLIHEDGARSSREPGDDVPAEWDLTIKMEVGGGHGLDEAELARRDPLDNKPWDGAPDDSLKPLNSVDDDYLSAESEDLQPSDREPLDQSDD